MQDKSILKVLRGETVRPLPIWLMRQAGRYLPEYRQTRSRTASFVEFCLSPEPAIAATLQPIRRFGFDAAILFSDILMIPHGLGRPLRFEEGVGPVLEPIEVGSLDGLAGPEQVVERLEPVYDVVRGVARALPPQATLIGFAGGPWTVATYMVEGGSSKDFARTKAMAYGAPDRFQILIDRLVAATIAHLSGQIEAGAEVVKLFDSWAGALNESGFERWVLAPTIEIVSALKARYPKVPIIGFPRGCGVLYQRYAAASGVDCVALDSAVPLRWAVATLPQDVALQGNLDPVVLIAGGDVLRLEIEAIIEKAAGRRFIFNLGHGVLPITPIAHVQQLVDQVRRGDGG